MAKARNPKNIVLCSDGTGKRWGVGAQTNVARLYQAVDTRCSTRQIRYYDNGVGTSANKYLRAFTGAVGFGLERNVLDLYEFLARNWQPKDRVYLFGFSRGAATVRAFAGMLQECGLVWIEGDRPDAKGYDETRLEELIALAMDAYRHRDPDDATANQGRLERFRRSVRVSLGGFNLEPRVEIEMIGVWDTVSALGFPHGPIGLQWLFRFLERRADKWFPHSFYEYQLDDRVKYACHALALDDERRSFRPGVWNEVGPPGPQLIEQVWFAGMHSDVGGGYPRNGLSSVTLEWMMAHAASRQLNLTASALQEATDGANPHGKLHDSRDGFAIFYRYQPRDLVRLCEVGVGKVRSNGRPRRSRRPLTRGAGPRVAAGLVKIHESVLDRLQEGSARYAPGLLPESFVVVGSPPPSGPAPQQRVSTPDRDTWEERRERVLSATTRRSALYHAFLYVTLGLVVWMLYLWRNPPELDPGEPRQLRPATDSVEGWLDGVAAVSQWVFGKLADGLNWLLPKATEGLVDFTLVQEPLWLVLLVALAAAMLVLRERLFASRDRAAQEARKGHLEGWSASAGANYVTANVKGRVAVRPVRWQTLVVKTLGLLVAIVFFVGSVRLTFQDQDAGGAAMTAALILAAPIAAAVLFSVLFRLTGRNPGPSPLESRPRGYDLDDVKEDWSEREIPTERAFLRVDLLFPLAYGAALALSLALAARYLGVALEWWHVAPLAILVLADWVENGALLVQLERFSNGGADALQEGWIRLASVATVIKYWGVAVLGFGGLAVLVLLVVLRGLSWI